MFGSVGTATNAAIRKYMNDKQVPQLFIASGASKWNDPKNYPWTMGWQPSYQDEARVYAKYIMKHKADAKVGVLYQNDDFGKDYLKGLKDAFGDKASMIVAEEAYDTVGADHRQPHRQAEGRRRRHLHQHHVTPKFAAQAIKKAAEIDWTPIADRHQRLGLGRRRDAAGRLREFAGHPVGVLSQGRRRSAMGQGSRHEEIPDLPARGLSRRQQARWRRRPTATPPRRPW